MSAPAVEVRGLDWSYPAPGGREQVLHGVDLEVDAGELVALAGVSGSGKTTLCHVVAGLEPLPAGTRGVAVLGREPARWRDWSALAVVPQQHGLVPGLTVRQNVALPALRAGVPDPDAAVDSVLLALDVDALQRHEVTAVSLGEQQRVAIARALVLRPRVLVLDEPTGHQDAGHVETVLAALRTAVGEGSAVLAATHDDELVDRADRVVRLRDGRVVGARP